MEDIKPINVDENEAFAHLVRRRDELKIKRRLVEHELHVMEVLLRILRERR